jgi:ABC-2 type transport system permease protein
MCAYLKTASLTAAAVSDSPLVLIDYGLRLLRVVVLIGLWRTILSSTTEPSVMPLAAVLTYTLMTEVFNDQISVTTTIVDTFWEGTVVLRFLRPLGLVRQFAAEMAGRWASTVLFRFRCCWSRRCWVSIRAASPHAGLLFIPSLALGIVVGLAIDFLFATIIVVFEQQPLIHNARSHRRFARVAAAAGLYPWNLGEIFSLLPFAATAWAPWRSIPHGRSRSTDRRAVFWAVVRKLVARLWRTSREKMVGYGG